MNKNRRLSPLQLATRFFGASERTVERLVKSGYLHNLSTGRNMEVDQGEGELVAELYRRWGKKALPQYPGTLPSTWLTAEMLGFTPQYVRDLARSKTLIGTRVGNKPFFYPSSIESYRSGVTQSSIGSLDLSRFFPRQQTFKGSQSPRYS